MSQITLARSKAEVNDLFEVRHRVFCEEKQWEPTRTNALESDHYDQFAQHIALRCASRGTAVGTVRVIPAQFGNASVLLPVERLCGPLRRTFPGFAFPERSRVAEASRLALMSEARGFNNTPFDEPDSRFGGRLPTVGRLMIACAHHAYRGGVRVLVILVQPKMLQFMGRYGVHPAAVGQPIEHRGLRVPCALDLDEIVARIPLSKHSAEDITSDLLVS
jgi:N-acyl amino acid synthase of PEP-CTERM/exosortase system